MTYFSDCPPTHRLTLRRSWLGTGGKICFVMLNPSTADEVRDDPTIRKCIGFSKRWGYSSLVVVNLFTYRATQPKAMKDLAKKDYALATLHANPTIVEQAASSDLIVAAWGTHGDFMECDVQLMTHVLPDADLYCIGRTQGGHPLHPCMAAYTDAPVPYRIASEDGATGTADDRLSQEFVDGARRHLRRSA